MKMKKTVVVCGGSKGIGAATVKALLSKGTRVICVSRSLGELKDINGKSQDLVHIECDLTLKESRNKATELLLTEKNIWGLVNNASGPSTGPISESRQEDYQLAFEAHLFSANDFTNAVLPQMITNRQGRIVNIISVTAKIPLENMVVSNTLRGAMLNWSKTLSKEIGKNNITVNNVLPGYTETDRLVEVIDGASKKLNISKEEYSQKILDQVPLRRFGRPEEIASVVTFLLSEDSSFVSGVSIPVDGGWTPCS
jgi:3-oxoacyl-[acyl-carrier protein] reductase